MFKKLIGLGALISVLTMVPVAMAAPSAPSQCSGMTFDHVIVSTTYGDNVKGTSSRDLIFVTGGSVVNSGAGDDCIVTSSGGNVVLSGSGNDRIVLSGTGNYVDGGSGNNKCYGVNNTDAVKHCIIY